MTDRAAARAPHPFTAFPLLLCVTVLAIALPAPGGPVALYAAVVVIALAAGNVAPVARAALLCLPLWTLLLLVHVAFGGLRTAAGLEATAAQAARLGAIATTSLALFARFDAARFIDAVAARGWPVHGAYLVAATLQAAPRFRRRAATILEAQRARGLRYRGSPVSRGRALLPLALPLVLGMVSDVDERAIALETRGMGSRAARTPLLPIVDRPADRALRWSAVAVSIGAIIWRLFG